MNKINLEDILFRHVDSLKDGSPIRNLLSSNEVFQNDLFDFFIKLMKDACQETLKLAAENAKYEVCQDDDGQESWIHKSNIFIDKRSILDTINEIE